MEKRHAFDVFACVGIRALYKPLIPCDLRVGKSRISSVVLPAFFPAVHKNERIQSVPVGVGKPHLIVAQHVVVSFVGEVYRSLREKTSGIVSEQLAQSGLVGITCGIMVAENKSPFYSFSRYEFVPHGKGVSIVGGKSKIPRHNQKVRLCAVYRSVYKIQGFSVQRASAQDMHVRNLHYSEAAV